MLDENFKDQMEEIVKLSPRGRQTMLFSATMTDEVRRKNVTREIILSFNVCFMFNLLSLLLCTMVFISSLSFLTGDVTDVTYNFGSRKIFRSSILATGAKKTRDAVGNNYWARSNWLTLLRNPCPFFWLFCLIALTYFYYVGEANKIK